MPGPMPPEGAEAPQQGGGVAQKLADAHSNLLQVLDLVQAKFPENAAKLAQSVQLIQEFSDEMGEAPGQAPKGPPVPGTTTPEAGAAAVKPAM